MSQVSSIFFGFCLRLLRFAVFHHENGPMRSQLYTAWTNHKPWKWLIGDIQTNISTYYWSLHLRVLQKHATIKYSSLLNLWLMLKLFDLSSKWTESIITVSISFVLFQIRIMKQAAWHFICACLISHSHLPPPIFTNYFRFLSMMQARWPDFLQELKLSIHKALRVFVYLFVCPTSVCILSQSVCHHIMSKANSLWAKQASVLQGLEFCRDHRALKF